MNNKNIFIGNALRHVAYWQCVNIGLGDGLVPSGNKQLPEQIRTKIMDTLRVIREQWVKT